MDAKLQTASHAEHDVAAHFGCDGDKNLPDAIFQFADIVIQLHGQYDHGVHLKFKKVGIDISSVFQTKFLVSYVNAFLVVRSYLCVATSV